MIVFEKWSLTKNLIDPDADAGKTTIARLFFFEVELTMKELKYNDDFSTKLDFIGLCRDLSIIESVRTWFVKCMKMKQTNCPIGNCNFKFNMQKKILKTTLLYIDFIVNIYTIGSGTSFYNLFVPLHTNILIT